MSTAASALTPSLPVPTGWSPAFLPGADALMMPLPGPDRTTPVFTVRRWNTNADLPEGSAVHDPRTDSAPESPRFGSRGGPDPARGVPVGMDRWSGGDWFGLRFLRLVPSLAGRPTVETRWLLWSANAGQPEGFDPLRDAPDLDATAVCAVADLALLEMMFDSMAGAIPGEWASALAEGHPSPQSVVRVGRVAADESSAGAADESAHDAGRPGSRQRFSTAGAWAGASMLDLAPDALAFLSQHPPGEPWGQLLDDRARPVVEAGLASAATRRLTDRAAVAAAVLQEAEQVSTLTIHSRHGRHRALELHRSRGLVAAVAHALPVPGEPDEVLLGLYPAERSAELVIRAAALGPSDSRRLGVDTVSRELLLRRTLDPDLPLPAELAADPRWQDLWSAPWLLWTLESGGADLTESTAGGEVLMGLNAARWGNHVLTRSHGAGDGGSDGDPDGGSRGRLRQPDYPDHPGDLVKLVPAQTSGLLITLLERLAPFTAPARR
ncbi:hypothetical protein GCM10010977_17480 [Citricoccus zhacaiensis]|uniref:Uncharacterized protein n=1 Tax=Citricoccus zhacaiensis TaxID=489142 RepID=A0ABQ2LZ81_9MICC|nr:hypothetical protein [Citricoccus zhacaiensis]GGO45224.1 hypothetical protein GCM10010977_17480 [Citricoccus zhacaiensis]